MTKNWDRLWLGCHLATMAGAGGYGIVRDGAIAVKDGRIAWLGTCAEVEATDDWQAAETVDASGQWVTPGLIDCHTHIVYGGNRVHEFEMRLNGARYEDIARAGGGILSTVTATRQASEADLIQSALPRVKRLMQEGVTTIEIKSGYGLDLDSELKMLRAARQLGRQLPLRVRTTFLGAHTLPAEYKGNRSGYVDYVISAMLPKVVAEGLADAVDVFCENIGFTPDETAAIFTKAHDLGLPVKIHAEQLSDLEGAALAAKFNALSADHLEYASEQSLGCMAASGTVATLLPGAFYFLKEHKVPPIDIMRRLGVKMAISTDCNPGSSPSVSLLLMMNMACILFRMTPEEALAGVTRNAAQALGLGGEVGTLEVGKRADLAFWDISEPAELSYSIGGNPCRARVVNGLTSWSQRPERYGSRWG